VFCQNQLNSILNHFGNIHNLICEMENDHLLDDPVFDFNYLDDDFDDENDEYDDEDNEPVGHLPKRYIRDGENPFVFYDDVQFKRRYRFSKDVVTNVILPQINVALNKNNNRGLPIAPVIQLLVCLRFYATSSFQVILLSL